MNYNIADTVIIGLVTISTLISFWRGFFKEVLILAFMVLSILMAVKFGSSVGEVCTFVAAPFIRESLGYFLVFSISNILGGLLRMVILKGLHFTTTPVADRIAGIGFGLSRGLLATGALIYMLNSTNIINTALWQEAKTIPKIHQMNTYVLAKLPKQWKKTLYVRLGVFENEFKQKA